MYLYMIPVCEEFYFFVDTRDSPSAHVAVHLRKNSTNMYSKCKCEPCPWILGLDVGHPQSTLFWRHPFGPWIKNTEDSLVMAHD